MQEKLQEDRIGWVTDQIAKTNVIPVLLDGFYGKMDPEDMNDQDVDGPKHDEGTKSKKGKARKNDTTKEGPKNGKGKQDKTGLEEIEIPLLQGLVPILEKLHDGIVEYETQWRGHQAADGSEKHDPKLAKDDKGR